MRKTQVTAYLPNKVGALAAVAKVLAAAKVNVEGISVVETADTGVVRMIVSSAARTAKALARAGIAYTTQAVEFVTLPNKAGSLARFAGTLAAKRVNIHYVYGTTCTCGADCSCRLVVSASDLKKVRKAAQ
ncbi:MAG: ACT domain-containing protein [Verrucomicrobiota bacterium]